MTLLFLGAVDAARAGELTALIDAAAAGASGPYGVLADRGDGRPYRTGGVAWLGLSNGAGELIRLADGLARACPPEITRNDAPKRTPSAHLTVARRADERVITALRTQQLGPLGVGWTVDRIVLMQSVPGPDGAHYRTVHERAL